MLCYLQLFSALLFHNEVNSCVFLISFLPTMTCHIPGSIFCEHCTFWVCSCKLWQVSDMCLCHVSILLSVLLMRTLTGCRNVSLSCEHFNFCVHANIDRLQKCVSLMWAVYFLCSCEHWQVAELCICHVSILFSVSCKHRQVAEMCLCHVSILLSVSCKHRQVAEMGTCCVNSLPSGLYIRTVTGCIAVSLSLCCLYYDPIMCACNSNLTNWPCEQSLFCSLAFRCLVVVCHVDVHPQREGLR